MKTTNNNTVTTTNKSQVVTPKIKGRLIVPATVKANAMKKAESMALTIETKAAIEAVAALKIDMKKTGTINGKAVNFLGHVIEPNSALGGKNCAIDTALIEAVNQYQQNGLVNFTQFISTLLGSKVIGGKVFTAKAMKAKYTAHCRHFNNKGKVPCTSRLVELYGTKGGTIAKAFYGLAMAFKNDTLNVLTARAKAE